MLWMETWKFAVLVAFALAVRSGNAYSSGAPSSACSTLTPSHGVGSQTIPGGYYIYSSLIDNGGSYTSGSTYNRKQDNYCMTKRTLIV